MCLESPAQLLTDIYEPFFTEETVCNGLSA